MHTQKQQQREATENKNLNSDFKVERNNNANIEEIE
jgi:hypothetical protein